MLAYTPPTIEDLQRLKDQLGYSGNQMAELASVASGSQWRKYTGGADPRAINLHMMFFIAARLALSPEELRKVTARMQEIGAQLDADSLAALPLGSENADA